ncbi:cobalamin synthesis protein P47K [Emticicia oligotrophica DSM 17448]|uniref:Cobalamin synthesis protein P47K n=1 Tax=Emticicia oligotrophica (strain DSM 17448 / CIP 109782 / MTCC 6937 / GPTSA100-15) TaxID=929562 RepID=A0ABN4ALZ3_EMTOG|nr:MULTISPECIES: GTP-binding protein [Emticicia]AFK03104.1 cobalamin synthesis protein P47K [Emticicia oligotrophica DSM 17448]
MKIPVNIITGFLGVGKTTTIKHILANKPSGERWAVIINEFGAVSIDHTAIEEKDDLTIREVAGGCICCTANLPMQVTLTTLLRSQKPDRILIEPTGMGHPEKILDLLQNQYLRDILEVRATICLVDPRKWIDANVRAHETFQDQINLADVLVANKADVAGEELVSKFKLWSENLYPPKLLIDSVSNGEINIDWLDIQPFEGRKSAFPQAHTHEHHHHNEEENELAEVGKPVKKLSKGLGMYSCGWLFSPEEVFSLPKLRQFFSSMQGVERAKGVFRIGKDWVLINAIDGEFSIQYIAYRRDSRIELIANYDLDWLVFEVKLKDCLI